MIPFKAYKLCPNICDSLFRLFKSCFQNCVVPVPVQWRIATEVYISKSGSPDPSILSKRLEKHIYNNKLMNSSIQKSCMEKVPGVGSICQLFEMN